VKEARERITAAALCTLLVEGPATIIAGVVLPVSQNWNTAIMKPWMRYYAWPNARNLMYSA